MTRSAITRFRSEARAAYNAASPTPILVMGCIASSSPDEAGVAAARRIEHALTAAPGHLVVVLVSGGGSSMLAAPVDGVSLEDLWTTTRVLLASGADVHVINEVRSRISRLEAGRLAGGAGLGLRSEGHVLEAPWVVHSVATDGRDGPHRRCRRSGRQRDARQDPIWRAGSCSASR